MSRELFSDIALLIALAGAVQCGVAAWSEFVREKIRGDE